MFKNNFLWSHPLTCSTSSSSLLGGAEGPTAISHPSLSFTWYPSQGLLHIPPPHCPSHPCPCIPAAIAPVQASSSLLGYHNTCLNDFPANSFFFFTFASAARGTCLKHLLDHSTSFLQTPPGLPGSKNPVQSPEQRFKVQDLVLNPISTCASHHSCQALSPFPCT